MYKFASINSIFFDKIGIFLDIKKGLFSKVFFFFNCFYRDGIFYV